MNRQQAPELISIKNIHTGFPHSVNNLYRINSEEGVFKLEIVFPNAGYGLADNKFHALYGMDLLLSGTSKHNASQISESLDLLGSYVFKNSDYYNASITIYGLNEHLSECLNIVKNSMENCIYPKNELDTYKNVKISELNINLNKTSFLANRAINELLFGSNHPYSIKSNPELIQSIQSEDLLKFKNTYLNEPYFIFTGPRSTDIESILNTNGYKLGLYSNEHRVEAFPNGIEFSQVIEKKGSTQNSIRLGKILPARTDSDYFKISLFNLILGGYFGSRLMKNIREEKGLTYGIHSSISPFKGYSIFKISSECNSNLTEIVKEEIGKEIEKLQTELISDEELTVARNYLLGNMLRNFDGAFNISERFKSYLELDTEPNYYENYFDSINKITASEVLEIANNYFDIKTLKYCISGEL
ncbi:MAG: insulinase family protein [Bacteroidia bacterium]|nr:insulinase family protein [Bacteroidia bacterium]